MLIHGGLASTGTAFWTFSGARVKTTLLGSVGPWLFVLGIAIVVAALAALMQYVASRAEGKRRWPAIALALLVMPWELYGSPVAINYFLGALGAFMGPLFGILMVDYWLIRGERVAVAELYKLSGDYTYRSGINPRALGAFVLEMAFAPPLWVHAVVWIPVIIGLAILLLRPAKA